MQEKEEEWKQVDFGSGKYFISNLCRLKSLHKHKELIRLPTKMTTGYTSFCLKEKGYKTKTVLAHRLVAKFFISNLENKLEINHKDGNRSNNSLENLEWCTHAENIKHAITNGLKKNFPHGEDGGMSRFKELEIKDMYSLYQQGLGTRFIADKYKTRPIIIWYIVTGRTWKHIYPFKKHIPKKYNYKNDKTKKRPNAKSGKKSH